MFVTDNLNTHQSETLVRLIAERCGLSEALGEKGKQGILACYVQPCNLQR